MKVLVTGGAGFIGSNVVRLLWEKGYDVLVLDDLSTGYAQNLNPFPEVEFVRGDVRNAEMVSHLMDGVDVVFHLAASVGNIRSLEDPIFDSDVNVMGTLRILEAARKAEVRKLVYSSSAAIFGEPVGLPIDESHPTQPDSPYGVSKLAGEKHCLCYAALYGLQVVCLRYFNVYGINQRYDAYGNVIPIFATRLLHGQPLIIYDDGEQTRDFVNVRDVARANLLAGEAGGINGVFNIGAGQALTINHLAKMIQEAAGTHVGVIHAPPRKGDVRHCLASIQAARDKLGYEPTVTFAEGLSEYVAWVRAEGLSDEA